MLIERKRHLAALKRLLAAYPVVALVGPRQIGKSTLARALANRSAAGNYFDLENSGDVARLQDPHLALGELRGLVVLDEIQRRPELFPALRVLADRRPPRARFLVLGSASPALLRQSSETLAGRIAFYELPGLAPDEIGGSRAGRLWLRGGFPSSLLARSEALSFDWRQRFIRSYLERDLPALGVRIAPASLERFWAMIAHHHGQLWNGSEIGRSLGVSDTTARGYLDTLRDAFVVSVLQPWHENLGKRQVKSPKLYVKDSGLLHALLDIRSSLELERHPKLGASWEGHVIESIRTTLRIDQRECFFWRTATGAELDLLVVQGRHRIGVEIKRTTAPSVTPSMRTALVDLGLKRLYVVHAGAASFDLSRQIRAIPFAQIDRIH